MKKYCCSRCFGDKFIDDWIKANAKETGVCNYCGSENEILIEPNEFVDQFMFVSGIYKLSEQGNLLVNWFKEDWLIFDNPKMDLAHSKDLLADILNDGEIVRQRFLPTELTHTDRLEKWEKLREELKHVNRYFPSAKIDEGRFQCLLEMLIIENCTLNNSWFRARIQEGQEKFDPDKMKCPPKEKATHGRANPAGIPYLYVASNPETAIAEVRPHTGEKVSVAVATLAEDTDNRKFKFVDLRNPRKSISPLGLGSEEEVALLRGDIEFLEKLGEELTRPVLPQVAGIHYVPSQYLCEFIKKLNFDGVLYRSSVGSGFNMALFDESLMNIEKVESYIVKKVSVEIDKT